jgi:hypothetical protein
MRPQARRQLGLMPAGVVVESQLFQDHIGKFRVAFELVAIPQLPADPRAQHRSGERRFGRMILAGSVAVHHGVMRQTRVGCLHGR